MTEIDVGRWVQRVGHGRPLKIISVDRAAGTAMCAPSGGGKPEIAKLSDLSLLKPKGPLSFTF